MLNNLLFKFYFISIIFIDAAEPWQFGFQDGASPSFEGITELHDQIIFYLVIILLGVSWILFSIILNFNSNNNKIIYKYHNHGTFIELIWTITPALILIAIAFPSFKLLYLMDNPIFDTNIIYLTLNSISVKLLNSSCTDLVPLGKISSTINIRLNKYCRENTLFPKQIKSQLVGHLLGDGSLTITHTSIYPHFVFTQTLKRFEYTWYVFNKLSHYCGSVPLLNKAQRKDIPTPFIQVYTRNYPFLLDLYSLFYQIIDGKRIKKISWDLLFYLDEIVLAHWAMDDGASARGGFYFHTKGFTFEECYILVAMLHYKFSLYCSVQNHDNRPVIIIRARSIITFRNLVLPHIIESMKYKLY